MENQFSEETREVEKRNAWDPGAALFHVHCAIVWDNKSGKIEIWWISNSQGPHLLTFWRQNTNISHYLIILFSLEHVSTIRTSYLSINPPHPPSKSHVLKTCVELAGVFFWLLHQKFFPQTLRRRSDRGHRYHHHSRTERTRKLLEGSMPIAE